MKKNLFMIAAVAIAAVACNKELPQAQIPVGEAKVYSAIADGNETKAVLNGKATNWENGDAILIYDGTSAAKYVTSLETPAPNADFVIADGETALAGEKVIAVYPEWADGYKLSVADVEGKTLSKAYLASNQNAKAGSYDPNTAIAMAYSEDANLEFKNATALLKFTVANENVKTVTVYSIGGEKITGEWALDYNNGAPKATPAEGDASKGWVELSAGEGTFEVGTEYFISVYPQTLASGFGLEFGFEGVSAKQLVKKYESSVEFKRNVILNLGNLEFTGTIEPEEPEEVVVDYWAVVGSMLDNWASEVKMTADGDWYVAEGIELTAADEFKFRANGDDNWTINRGAEGDADVVVIADNVETTVIQGGKNFCVSEGGFYSLYINKSATKVKVVKTADLPVESVPDQPSDWALAGTFNNWADKPMVTTKTPDLYVVKNVEFADYAEFKVKKKAEGANDGWGTSYGVKSINYINSNVWFAVQLGSATNISIVNAGTYDIYFDLINVKVYAMAAGEDYSSAIEQTANGKAPVINNARTIYLKAGPWPSDNAWFIAYTWGGASSAAMVKMVESSKGSGIYECEIPNDRTNIIFLRKNPVNTSLDWNDEWNRFELTLPSDKNCFTVTDSWGNGGWSNI